MKSIKLIILAISLSLLLPMLSKAQNGYYFSLNYSPSIPIGDVTDFTNGFSWRGGNLDFRFFVDDNLTIGVLSGWNVFREESDGIVSEVITGPNNTATISAKQFRFTNSVPLLLTSHFHWGEEDEPRPYIGVGAGVYYITQRLEMGLYAAESQSTRFGLSPMAGVILPAFYSASVNLGVQYHLALAAKDYNPVNYLSFNVGLTWGP